MAYPRFSAATPVAQQIRTTALGVSNGGTQGRSSQTHKGVGLNQNSGGANTAGSGRKTLPTRVTNARPAAAPKVPGGYRYVMRNGKRVAVRWDLLTAAEKARFAQEGSGVAAPVAGAPTASQPVSGVPAGVTPNPNQPINWDALSSYTGTMADINFEYGNQAAALNRQLADNKIVYDRGAEDAKRGYVRGLDQTEDALNRQGLLRSGKREAVEADQHRDFNRFMEDLRNQYGDGASGRIAEDLLKLDQWKTQQERAAEAAARLEYDQLYPAAPVDLGAGGGGSAGGGAPAGGGGGGAAPTSTAPAPVRYGNGLTSNMFNGMYLMVWDTKQKRNVAKAIDTMTHKEVMAALSRDINKKYIAGGFYYANGHIYAR